jgi:hypothetical protein
MPFNRLPDGLHTRLRAPRSSNIMIAVVVVLLALCSPRPARPDPVVSEQAVAAVAAMAAKAEASIAASGDHGVGAHRHHIRKHVRRPERPRLQGGLQPCAARAVSNCPRERCLR